MAAFPAIIIILRHEEVPRPFCPAMNSFWYLICNYILGYCERPEQLAILISMLLLRMCGEYTYPAFFGLLLRITRVWSSAHSFTRYLPFCGCAGDWLEMGFQVHCGTVLGDAFSTWRQICPPKQSHNALSRPSRPISLATSKWRIWSRAFWIFITWNFRKA